MTPPDYRESIALTLRSIGDVGAGPASGSATALTLSLAIECVALHLSLTLSSTPITEDREYYDALGDRLAGWREEALRAFHDDAEAFEGVIRERGLRGDAAVEDREAHVVRELEHLEAANRVLLRVEACAQELRIDAELMRDGNGVAHARSESGVANHLAIAAQNGIAEMLALNVRTAVRRASDFGIHMRGVAAIRAVAARTPATDARQRLHEALTAVDWDR